MAAPRRIRHICSFSFRDAIALIFQGLYGALELCSFLTKCLIQLHTGVDFPLGFMLLILCLCWCLFFVFLFACLFTFLFMFVLRFRVFVRALVCLCLCLRACACELVLWNYWLCACLLLCLCLRLWACACELVLVLVLAFLSLCLCLQSSGACVRALSRHLILLRDHNTDIRERCCNLLLLEVSARQRERGRAKDRKGKRGWERAKER